MADLTARPSPTESATGFPVGHIRVGNDQNQWMVVSDSRGVQRWKKIISSSKATNTTPRFKVGDKLAITKTGTGFTKTDVGKYVKVTEVGIYTGGTQMSPGYKVEPLVGKFDGSYSKDFFFGEKGFTLIDQNFEQYIKDKTQNLQNKMKTNVRGKAVEQRNIETTMVNKDEVFRMLALAEATGLPLLLVGPPGVGKTKAVIDYAKAWLNKDNTMTAQDFADKMYILETDEGTKASEVKGMPDLNVLFTQNKYELNAPIATADIVVINEVDKASSGIRNAMLGVMNEKFLFNGKHKVPCKWKLFVATCNEIPKEEVGNPFWDRFMLKLNVSRVAASDMMDYYQKGARNFKQSLTIGIPNKAEIDAVVVSPKKLEKYLEVGYHNSSDRTLTFVPNMAKAVSYIWDCSIDKALVKTAELMINSAAASQLSDRLMSNEVKAMMSKIEMLQSYTSNEKLELAIAEIENQVNTYVSKGLIDEGQVGEIEVALQQALDSHPARKDYISADDIEELLADGPGN